jgi:hypothetical protein
VKTSNLTIGILPDLNIPNINLTLLISGMMEIRAFMLGTNQLGIQEDQYITNETFLIRLKHIYKDQILNRPQPPPHAHTQERQLHISRITYKHMIQIQIAKVI